MSKNRIRHNLHTIFVSGLMFTAFFILLFYYQDSSNPNNYYVENGGIVSPGSTTTDTVIPSQNSTSTNNTPAVVNVKKPVQVGHAVGIAAGSKLVGFSDSALDMELRGMVDLGVKWVRFDIEWGFVQYDSPAKYDWSKYDRIVDALNKYNIKILPILTYTPEWARVPGCRGGSHCPPQYPENFAEFAAEAVKRYKKKNVHYWEIWNEPNSYDFWATKADCVAYTELLKVTYPRMRALDPEAFIITGGVAQVSNTDVNIGPLDFIECIYKNGGKNYFDAIGFHPYTFPKLPSDNKNNGWGRMGLGTNNVRNIMAKYNDLDKKIWITEFGVPTGGPDPAWYVSEEFQSQTVADAMKLYKDSPWAGPLFFYTFLDSGYESTSNENFFGLVRFDGSLKPAYGTLKSLILKGI